MMEFSLDSLLAVLAQARANMTPDTITRALLVMALLALPLLTWRLARGGTPRTEPGGTMSAGEPAAHRIRQARTLASGGLDADAIARRTGIARDIAVLLVAGRRPDEAAGPGRSFRWRPRGSRAL